MFFFKSYVASYGYVCRPGTDRIPEGVPKKFLRNRNRDSCEKSATGEENTGILRIPAGITNLGGTSPKVQHIILFARQNISLPLRLLTLSSIHESISHQSMGKSHSLCLFIRFQYYYMCPKRVGSFGYSTLASEEKASEK